jgi:hypothetical protein
MCNSAFHGEVRAVQIAMKPQPLSSNDDGASREHCRVLTMQLAVARTCYLPADVQISNSSGLGAVR